METFKQYLHRVTDNYFLVFEPYQTCPLSDVCPFSEKSSETPCEGTNENRATYFYCNIIELWRLWSVREDLPE